MEQKRIMNVAKEKRTEEEKKNLQRVLSGLKCFRRYPPSVKAQLASATYFQYYGPDRTIVRQDDEAQALYFILSGHVLVTQRNFDPILNEWITTTVGTMEAGAMFGEVSLLHGIKRTATIITADHCELLKLRKDDFDEILKASVMAEWDEIRSCMGLFTGYFQSWDQMTIRECCILSKVKHYKIDDVILSDDIGDKKYVYFLIDGQCHLIEHMTLQMREMPSGAKTYRLMDNDDHLYDSSSEIKMQVILDPAVSESAKDLRASFRSEQMVQLEGNDEKSVSSILRSREEQEEEEYYQRFLSKKKKPKQKIRIENHFLRVAVFNPLSTFNIGERFRRRFVLAVKRVKVLLIPRYWLVQKNKELWAHIRVFLNQRLPSTDGLFREFLQQRRWMAYRKQIVDDILHQCKKVNPNNAHNVPYSIRINQDLGRFGTKKRELGEVNAR